MFITGTHCRTTSKDSGCRIICMWPQQTSPKRWFGNVNVTSYWNITNSVYPVKMSTIRHYSILELCMGTNNQVVAPGFTRPLHATANRLHFLKVYDTVSFMEQLGITIQCAPLNKTLFSVEHRTLWNVAVVYVLLKTVTFVSFWKVKLGRSLFHSSLPEICGDSWESKCNDCKTIFALPQWSL